LHRTGNRTDAGALVAASDRRRPRTLNLPFGKRNRQHGAARDHQAPACGDRASASSGRPRPTGCRAPRRDRSSPRLDPISSTAAPARYSIRLGPVECGGSSWLPRHLTVRSFPDEQDLNQAKVRCRCSLRIRDLERRLTLVSPRPVYVLGACPENMKATDRLPCARSRSDTREVLRFQRLGPRHGPEHTTVRRWSIASAQPQRVCDVGRRDRVPAVGSQIAIASSSAVRLWPK
jgi:hypothetical protein